MAQGIIAEFVDGSTGYLTTPAQVVQALTQGVTLLRPNGSAYIVVQPGQGAPPLLDGSTPDQVLTSSVLSSVIPTADNCAPLFTGGLIRIYYQNSFGQQSTQDFPGTLAQFKALRPDVTVTGCEVFDRSGKPIVSQSALDAFAKANLGTTPATKQTATASAASAGAGATYTVLGGRTLGDVLDGGCAINGDVTDPLCNGIDQMNGVFDGITVAAEIQAVIQALITILQAIVTALAAIVTAIAAAVKAVLAAAQKIYESVIKPIINKIEAITSKLGQILDQILKPYLDLLQRIRQAILNIYRMIFLPIISAIQRIRQALALLKILHVPGVAKLDAALQRIQGKLIGVITQLLNRVNDHSGLFNILLTARMVFQHGVFLNSAYVYQGQLQQLWWDGQTRYLTPDEQASVDASQARLTATTNQDALNLMLAGGPPLLLQPPGPNETALNNLLQGL